MTISPLADKPRPKEMLVDLAPLEREYLELRPISMTRARAMSGVGTSLTLRSSAEGSVWVESCPSSAR